MPEFQQVLSQEPGLEPLRVLALLYCRGFSGVFGPALALEELSPSPTVVRGASLQQGTELAVS